MHQPPPPQAWRTGADAERYARRYPK